MDSPKLSLNENGVVGSIELPSGHLLEIHLSRLVQQATGLHARIALCVDTTELARTVMNVERLEDRVKLANAAYKDLHGDIKKIYPADWLKIHLAYVCGHAWETWQEAYMPHQEAGQEALTLQYLVDPFVLQGGGTILFGPPGAGKSYLGMGVAVSVDAGLDTIWPVFYTPTMWVNLERSELSVRWRLAHINTALGLPPDRDLMILHARGKRFQDIYEIIQTAIARHSIGFVVVDSLSRMGVGSLVKDEPINEAIDLLNGMGGRHSGISWLALGHTPTYEEGHVYGGNLWTAGADITAQLVSVRRPSLTGIRVETFKSNDTPIDRPSFFALEFYPELQGLKVLRRSTLKEFPELAMRKKSGLVDDLILYLKDVGSATATQAARDLKAHPRNRIAEAFTSRPDLFIRHGSKNQGGQPYALLAPLGLLE